MQSRIEYWDNLYKSQNINPGVIRFVTGSRELWLEIDKMPHESWDETKAFFLKLAAVNNIAVNPDPQFEKRSDGRTYLKYAEGETRRITETMMAQLLFQEHLGIKIDNIVDSATVEGRARPDTESGANAAYSQFDSSSHFPQDRKPSVIIISNQPYCLRQLLTIGSAIANKSGKENSFDLEVAGEENQVGITAIHSEFGALIGESYLQRMRQFPLERKRHADQMMYSKRQNIDLEIGETFSHHPTTKIVKPLAAQIAAETITKSLKNASQIGTSSGR